VSKIETFIQNIAQHIAEIKATNMHSHACGSSGCSVNDDLLVGQVFELSTISNAQGLSGEGSLVACFSLTAGL
jgi:hypothetical protein